MTSLVPFATEGKNGLVNGLFHSHSTRRNVSGPIRLHCVSDFIHGNNCDQEKPSDSDSMQGARLIRSEPRSQKVCQEFYEWSGCV